MVEKTDIFSIRLILTGLSLLLCFSYFGCGIKGPPVPPRRLPVPAIQNLAYQVADGSATLTWSLPGPLSGRQAEQAAFGLYRSRTALEKPACDGCPQVFEKVATVSYVHTDANRYSIDVPLEPGYRYVFKVRLETGGSSGPDSNSILFDHLSNVP